MAQAYFKRPYKSFGGKIVKIWTEVIMAKIQAKKYHSIERKTCNILFFKFKIWVQRTWQYKTVVNEMRVK